MVATSSAALAHAASADAQIVAGFVVGLTITDPGFGYTQSPVVTIKGGGGSGAVAVAKVSNGIVTGFTVIDAGFGYTSAPTVQISPPGAPLKLRLEPTHVQLNVNAVLGRTYTIETSEDRAVWAPLLEPFVATSETMLIEVPMDRVRNYTRITLIR